MNRPLASGGFSVTTCAFLRVYSMLAFAWTSAFITEKWVQVLFDWICFGGGGGNIHIFVFTAFKNNWFQKKLIMQNSNTVYEYAPPIIELATPLVCNTGKKCEIHTEICNCTTKSIVYPYYFDTISIVCGNIQLLWIIKIHSISNKGPNNVHSI
jgi:hypothetical protein